MTLILGLSDAGLQVPRTADYIVEIRDRFRAETGLDVAWDADLMLGSLTAIMAQLLGDQAEVLQAVYDSWDVNAARGVQASNIAALVGVIRHRATKGQVILTLGGDPGTIITEGKLVEGGGLDGRARWILISDVTIGATRTVEVVAEAENAGQVVGLEDVIDKIVTPVPGWETVTNVNSASAGLPAEGDPALRVRRAQSIQVAAGDSLGSIRGKLLELSYVQAAAIIDNPDNEDKVVEGIGLLAHSFLPVILPDTLTTEQQREILRILYDNTPPASRSSGTDVVGTITGGDGFEKLMSFDYGIELQANIVVNLTMSPGYSVADAGPALRKLVEEHEATLLLGQDLLNLKIAAFASTIPGVIGMVALINGNPNLTATAVEKIVPGTWLAT